MQRIVSLWFPHLPIERLKRALMAKGLSSPLLSAHVPFVLVTPGARGLRLAACNDEARARGLQPGERLADARAKVPDLASAVHEPTGDAASLLRMARWAERWSPWVAMDPPDGLLLDVTGVAHLFGGEAMLVADMTGRFGKLNVTARAGLAGTAPAARAIARFGQLGSPIVAEGAERTALATLPVEALDLDADTVMTLRRAGLKRIGQLYDVPRASLARRFRAKDRHARLMERLDASLGLTQTPLSPLSPPVEFAVRHSVMEPLKSHDGVLAMLEHLTRTLCLKLTKAGEGAVYLELALYRADGSRAIVQAGLSRPSARAEHLERLLAPRLEKIDMGFGVDAASLKARETQALSAVQETLTGEGGAGTELAELADRIAAREDGAPVSVNLPAGSHQPERAEDVKGFGEAGKTFLHGPHPSDREAGFARARAGVEQSSTAVSDKQRPITLLDRPEEIDVIASVPDGPPVRFTWRHVARKVLKASGPERLAPDWWRRPDRPGHRPRTRDYYTVEDEAGRRYWIYREGLYEEQDRPAPSWFVHGLFE
jgi:protein ImuB